MTNPVKGDFMLPNAWRLFVRPLETAEANPCGDPIATSNQRLRDALEKDDPALTAEVLCSMPERLLIDGREVEGIWGTANNSQFDFRPLFGAIGELRGIHQPNNHSCCGRVAYVFLEIEAVAEGVATLGMGADSWVQAWLNGTLVLDRRKQPMPFPPSIQDCLVDVSLRAGTNILAIRYVSGRGSSTLAVGGPRELRRGNFKSILADPFLYEDRRWLANGLTAMPGGKALVDIGTRRELFVDDYMIDAMTGGSERRLHHPVPREAVFHFDQPWEGNFNGCFQPCSLVEEGGRVLLYYKGANHPGPEDASRVGYGTRNKARPESCCLAIGMDGIHFSRPELGLCDYKGSKGNNMIWDGASYFTPFLDANPDAPASQRFKAISGHPKGGLGAYASPDGIHWSMLSDNPVITRGAFDSQNLAFWDPVRRHYVEYHRGNEQTGPREGVRGIMTSISNDFIHWTEPRCVDYADDRREHMYTNCIRPYTRAPHIHLGTPGRFIPYRKKLPEHIDGGISDAILMSSRDMNLFHRWEEAFIRPDTERKNWADRNCFPAWGMIQSSESEISLYWCEHNGFPTLRLRRGTLRTDGFVSLHAGADVGEMLSRPFRFEGTALDINYATSAIGTIRIELCDPSGNALEGFSLAESDPIFGNEISHLVRWNSRGDLSRLTGETVRLRVRLHDADLYSFAFIDPGAVFVE